MNGYTGLKVNSKGHLTISNIDTVYLAEKYGTPLYVMNEDEIINRLKKIKECHMERYNGMAYYAGKAFLTKDMCRLLKNEGFGLDVVSGGELYTAYKSDFPMENILFHGNNKSFEELKMAVDLNVGRIVIDNFYEIEQLIKLLKEKSKKVKVMIRVSTGVDGHTHEYIKTGQIDSKFGFTIVDNSAMEAVKKILSCECLELTGIHSHNGSQLKDKEVYGEEIKILTNFYKEIYDELGIELEEINVGGGFGIYYVSGDERPDISYFTDFINDYINVLFKNIGLKAPRVLIEPGRWVVGEAGITLYRAGAIKEISGVRKYVSVDGGMADNPRPPLYGAKYLAVVANKGFERAKELVTISGRCCESGDILIKDIVLPEIISGDIIAVLSTGAYNFSMASNYNRLPRPAVVMVKEGVDRLSVKRETYEDLLDLDI